MKKLLSFLAALLLLGTMTVDMKAATIYVEDDGDSYINLWWWGGTSDATSLGFQYDPSKYSEDDSRKEHGTGGPNLKTVGTKVTGSDGKVYYTYVIDDGTTGVKITNNGSNGKQTDNLTTSDFDYVFTVSGGKTSTTVASVTGGGGGGETNSYTIYYEDSESWSTVNAYVYDSSETKFKEWPGESMTYNSSLGKYEYTFEWNKVPAYIIFNNFNNGSGSQHPGNSDGGYTFENNATYNKDGKVTTVDPVETTYTVKYNNGRTAWDAVWAYAVDNSNNAIEASKKLTEVTDGIYTYTFTTTATPAKVYFNNSEITDTASLTGYDFENNKTYGEAAVSGDTYTVYYNNSETKWTNVYGFWKYGSTDGNGWPGEKLTANSEGKYVFTFTTEKTPTTVIFNNGSTGAGNQTADFTFENGKTYGEKEAVDYSSYKAYIRYVGNNWTAKEDNGIYNLNADGTLSVDLALAGGKGFNFQIKNGNETINYTGNSDITLNSPITLTSGSAEAYFATKDSRYDESKNTTIKFDFVNNKLTLEQEVPAVPTVYFICPEKWTEPKIYMYNNAVLDENGKPIDSGGFGSKGMTEEATELAGLVDLATGEKILKYSPSAEDMEKFTGVIFNNAGSPTQTRNLVLVDHAIYRVTNVMLPSMKYFPDAEHEKDKIQVYSTTDDVVEYNSIYLYFGSPQETPTDTDDKEFHKFNESVPGKPHDNRIGVNIYVGGTKDSNRVTGNEGTAWMYNRTIAGKEFLRIDFPDYLIKDGTTIDKIEFYEFNYGNGGGKLNVSSTEEDMKKPGNSFWYENVEYTNGRVFYRPPMADKPVHVSTLFTPLNLWLVAKDPENGTPGSGYIKYTDNQGTEHTYKAGETGNDRVRLMPSENANGKITYNLHNVDRGSTFNLAAQFKDGDGNYVYYAYTGNTNEFTLVPNNDYTLVTSEQKTDMENITTSHYIIDPEGYPALTMCDITVRWADQVIFVSPVRTTADFSYESLPLLEGDNDPAASHRRINAIADNGAPAYVYVSHNKNFGTDAKHYLATNTSIIVRPEFQDYIKGRNKGATVGELTAVEDENALTADDQRLSKVAISAHTAGIYSLYVAQTKTLDEFHTTSIRIPVRVSPTLQSIGLLLNENYGIFEQDGILKCTPNYNHEVVETTAGGNTIKWDKNRVKLVASQAEAGDDLEIWFADASALTTNQADAKYVIRREASAIEPEDELNTDPAALGYTKYDINHTLKLVGDDGKGKDQDISFIVKQSGITGAPQTVKITPSDTNLPTAVDEIEAAAAEAVYYNLNGIRVDAENLQPGIYVVVKGTEVSKVLVR